MIFRLLFLLCLPVVTYFLVTSISQRFSFTARQNRILFFITVALLVIGVLVVMGRLPVQFIFAPIGVAVTFFLRMMPTILRLLPMWQMVKGKMTSAQPRESGQTSTIRTDFLEMELQHASGDMDGVVLKGAHAKKTLSSMPLPALLELYGECAGDADSVQVLQAYLDRSHTDWQEHAHHSSGPAQVADESVMTRQLALEILGISDAPDKETVVKAHRQLMQKLHPDRGGSDYLAKKINAAKDFLADSL